MIYGHLATIYDELMSHVPYAKWAMYVNQLLLHYGGAQERTLDAACGTGAFLAHFAPDCREVCGFDSSKEMVNLARQRFRTSDTPTTFMEADLCSWNGRGDFNLVLCLYDSINYMLTRADLVTALRNLRNSLTQEGLLIFDVSTLYNAQHNFHGFEETDVIDNISYTRRATLNKATRILYNDFSLHQVKGREIANERHSQRLYTIKEITSAASAAGLICVAVLDGFTFNEGNEYSERIHFVTRKGC